MFVDVDGLKRVSDNFGHEVGDAFVVVAAHTSFHALRLIVGTHEFTWTEVRVLHGLVSSASAAMYRHKRSRRGPAWGNTVTP